MKITVEEETGMTLVCERPDETLKTMTAQKIRNLIEAEVNGFLTEVQAELRRLKPGGKVSLKSRPIEIRIERPIQDPTPLASQEVSE